MLKIFKHCKHCEVKSNDILTSEEAQARLGICNHHCAVCETKSFMNTSPVWNRYDVELVDTQTRDLNSIQISLSMPATIVRYKVL